MRRWFVLAIGVALEVACVDDPRYVYTARKYDAANGCLADYKAIETVRGEGVSSTCPLACLTVDETVYVSTVCPPLPENAEALDESDPGCQAALDASRMEASCSALAAEEPGSGKGGGEDVDAGGEPAFDATPGD